MLHDITSKRNGEVVAKTFFAELRSEVECITGEEFLIGDSTEVIARVLNLEEELVAFFSILAHQRREILHRWGFYLLKTVEGIYLTNRIEYVVALRHFNGREVACSFWN